MDRQESRASKYLNRRLLSVIVLTICLVTQPGTSAIAQATVDQKAKPVTVAIVVWDGVQIIDYSGPWEVFGQAGFKVFTVAAKTDPITTSFGQKVTPDYTFDNSPQTDILLLPGGGTQKTADDPRAIKWIQDEAKNARYVMSVCTGAFILARTGLLDGLTATTFHSRIDALAEAAPKVKVVYDQRVVDNGKVITTAGLSSGIDGALHVVEKILGRGEAESEALGLEYNWQGDSTPARAAFADRYLPDFQGFEAKMISVNGGLDHWDMQVSVSKPSSVADIMDMARKQVVSATPHTGSAVALTGRSSQSQLEWKFKDDLGRPWVGSAAASRSADEPDKFNMTVTLTLEKK